MQPNTEPRSPDCAYARPFLPQRRGSRLAAWVLGLFGWRVQFHGFPRPQGVLIVYPHTSAWDFVLLVLAKWAMGVRARFFGKDTLFNVPLFGRWLRWLGGMPVNRQSPQGVVQQMVQVLRQQQQAGHPFWLGLAPEGTRRYLPGWRSGFYRLALQTGVPLGCVRLDYARREITALDFFPLSGDEQADMRRLAAVYAGVRGYKPEQAAPISLLPHLDNDHAR